LRRSARRAAPASATIATPIPKPGELPLLELLEEPPVEVDVLVLVEVDVLVLVEVDVLVLVEVDVDVLELLELLEEDEVIACVIVPSIVLELAPPLARLAFTV